MSDSYRRTARGLWDDTLARISDLETRLAIGQPDTGWVDLTASVAFASGWSHVEDVSEWGGIKARRVGALVQIIFANIRAAAATFSVPLSGNLTNSIVLTGVPAMFRPAPDGVGALSSGSAGPVASFHLDPSGTLRLSAVVPDPTQTGSVNNAQIDYSAVGMYFAGTSTPMAMVAMTLEASQPDQQWEFPALPNVPE